MKLNWGGFQDIELGPLYAEVFFHKATGSWEYQISLSDPGAHLLEVGYRNSEEEAKASVEKWVSDLYDTLRDALQEDE